MTATTTSPFFTVFTPTYNRAHTLHRVFDSLCNQTFRDFEWLVIDDGSTDKTSELISEWAKVSPFAIRYIWQQNSGRHVADNAALLQARGQMCAGVDSDDALVADALEKVWRAWHEIPEKERCHFSSIVGHCCDQNGKIIGRMFPTSPFDTNFREFVFTHGRFGGQKWEASQTSVSRQYLYPEIAGTNRIPEGLTGLQSARTFKIRCVNEIFRVYYVDDAATGATLSSRRNLAKEAPGRIPYYNWLLNHELNYFWRAPVTFIKAAAMLPVAARYAGHSSRDVWQGLELLPGKLLVVATLPLSLLLGIYLRLRGQWK